MCSPSDLRLSPWTMLCDRELKWADDAVQSIRAAAKPSHVKLFRSVVLQTSEFARDYVEAPFRRSSLSAQLGQSESNNNNTDIPPEQLTHIVTDSASEITIVKLDVLGGSSHTHPLSGLCIFRGPSNCSVRASWKRFDSVSYIPIKNAHSWIYQPSADDIKLKLFFVIEISHPTIGKVTQEVAVPESFIRIDPAVALEVERCVKSSDACWEVTCFDSVEFHHLRITSNSLTVYKNEVSLLSITNVKHVQILLDYANPYEFYIQYGSQPDNQIRLMAQSHIQRDVILLSVRSYVALSTVCLLLSLT
eukprot:TRINITY_DN9015_c0_g1_i3.p1 TRINITY_DN9015_c0_g1~~TRINITY_DN9015_c0_g1_i3.p1  ORF type:complete len:305 (+),score=57.02 TRINITY_DN9015_c0_g1_i3:49-963(+)